MILKFWAFITRRKVILLLHHDGDVTRTIEFKKLNPFTGNKRAYVNHFYKIGPLDLFEDGSVKGRTYIEKWMYEK